MRQEIAIGIGLRAPHATRLAAERPALSFLEVHAENYMSPGPARDGLLALRRDYEISVHGVGLSLGSANGIDGVHLGRLKSLVESCAPFLVSEHLAWNVVDGAYLNDLLPLPYTEESLEIVAANVGVAQDALGCRLLIENPSRYLRFRHSPIPEAEFLSELVARSGCGLLLDVNNLHVSSHNVGEAPRRFLAGLPKGSVEEIHLAGHARTLRGDHRVLIDDHGSPVVEEVWALYRQAVSRFGAVASLVEWDKNLPPLEILLGEADRARHEAAWSLGADALAS
jgi:uncharacterized protein (UPF0276 family)